MDTGIVLERQFSDLVELREESTIAGTGLFARAFIPKGTILAVKGGRIYTKADLDRADPDVLLHSSLRLWENRFLAGREGMTCINHSCNPNAVMLGTHMAIAFRDIEPGEEITLEYATFWDYPEVKWSCRCGSDNCRGEFSSDDWKNQALWKELLQPNYWPDFFTPWLRHRLIYKV
jgi:uncharacterized protein